MTRYPNPYLQPQVPQPPRRRMPWWGWVLVAVLGVTFLSCAGVIGFLYYIGSTGPDTKAYVGNEVPSKFIQTVRDLDLLKEGEQIRFFYSDALTDITEGFYFVTQDRVVIYRKDAGDKPATIVPFSQIESTEIDRGKNWLEDSTITLYLKNGDVVAFPVSTEGDRDTQFLKAIKAPTPKVAPRP